MDEIIKTVLVRENLACAAAAVTQLSTEHKIAVTRKPPVHRDGTEVTEVTHG